MYRFHFPQWVGKRRCSWVSKYHWRWWLAAGYISHLWIPTWSVGLHHCLAINGPDEKFQHDLLISFLSMKIGNIEELAGGKSLLETLLDVLGCSEYSGRYLRLTACPTTTTTTRSTARSEEPQEPVPWHVATWLETLLLVVPRLMEVKMNFLIFANLSSCQLVTDRRKLVNVFLLHYIMSHQTSATTQTQHKDNIRAWDTWKWQGWLSKVLKRERESKSAVWFDEFNGLG